MIAAAAPRAGVGSEIIAVGTSPNPLVPRTTKGLEIARQGTVIADENGKTTKKAVYAGGDVVTGAATVISAMGAGKKAAVDIHEYLSGEDSKGWRVAASVS